MGTISDPNEVLLTAILSLDVYYHDPSLIHSNNPITNALGSSLANATLENSDYNDGTEFGATAWDWNGQTIIAYRRTVDDTVLTFLKSALNGYGAILGERLSTQVPEATNQFGSADSSNREAAYPQ